MYDLHVTTPRRPVWPESKPEEAADRAREGHRTSPWKALYHGSFTLSRPKSFEKILDVARIQSEMF